MMILTKDVFQSIKNQLLPVQREYVDLNGEYGVYVIELTAAAAIQMGENDGKVTPADWVAACCVDENGYPVFDKEDVLQMPVAVFNTLVEAALRLNGLSRSEELIEEAEKNSEEAAS